MAYYSGVVSSFQDLKSVIEVACVSEGWSLSYGILSNSGCFVSLEDDIDSSYARLVLKGGTGQTGSSLDGQNPNGQGVTISASKNHPIQFPINYELHIFDNPAEVYCVINYNSLYYQHLAFGKSSIQGIGGTGGWISGTKSSAQSTVSGFADKMFFTAGYPTYLSIATYDGYSSLFASGALYSSSMINADLDGALWYGLDNGHINNCKVGTLIVAPLLLAQPNPFNLSSVLLPVKMMAVRPSGGLTTLCDLKNARYLRIDYLNAGDIITIGPDRWKCYPMFRRNSTERDGKPWVTGADHSGTFAYAVRFTG